LTPDSKILKQERGLEVWKNDSGVKRNFWLHAMCACT